MSFYYLSSYALKDPKSATRFTCGDTRAGGCAVAELPPVNKKATAKKTKKKKPAAKKKKRR
jgi:hypothetical protein